MEKTDLTSPSYWEAPGIDIRLNPRLEFETAGLAEFVGRELGLESALVFATSGSTASGPKFVVLEKRAILASAKMVNRHLDVSNTDRWLSALTTFHVGGVGVWARAWKAGCRVIGIDGNRWDRSGRTFVEGCREHGITLTALTPTHLHDVIGNGQPAPGSLRAVLVGGAALEETLLRDAVRSGWPILRTYGMTEAASQIATDGLAEALELERSNFLPVLSDWRMRTDADQRLEISGEPLFRGYAIRDRGRRGGWKFERCLSGDGFFTTGDQVRLDPDVGVGTRLCFLGRADDRVKKLGEPVSLTSLRAALGQFLGDRNGTILALPHSRLGNELVAVVEGAPGGTAEEEMAKFNESVAPFERIDRVRFIGKLPRTDLGKVAHGELTKLLDAKGRDVL